MVKNELNKLLELRSENDIELHVKKLKKEVLEKKTVAMI